jgi:signal transduction histidine kinase/ActR/RegA family two-component response regulator
LPEFVLGGIDQEVILARRRESASVRAVDDSTVEPPGVEPRKVELGLPGVHIGAGDHVCAFHRSGKGADVLLPYVRAGVAAGDRCICLVDASESLTLQSLTGNVAAESSETEIWIPSESYLRDGDFRLPRMMSFWEECVGRAIDSGRFDFVRSVGDMSWALEAETDARDLVSYESELNRFLPRYPQVMLCLYDLDQFNGEVLIGILQTHPLVLLAGMVMENPYYIEPDKILTSFGTTQLAGSTSAAMRMINLGSSQSRLNAVLVLAMLMAECVEEDKIVQLGVTLVPALAPCRAIGVHMDDDGWDLGPPTGLSPEDLRSLPDRLFALAPHGGQVQIEGEPCAWALPLTSLGGRVGDLVVAAATEPTEEEFFVLRSLARKMGVAIAQARSYRREAHANRELRASLIELEHARAESQEARGAAETASLAKSEFIAAMSHELRTPLNAVVGFAQLLDMSDDRPSADQEQIDHILQAGRHLEELTDQVLDIARIEAGHLDLASVATGWSEAADEAVSLVRPIAAERGITVETRLPATPGLLVVADKLRLRQVLLNLLSNAVKYNRDGGTVTVEVIEPPDAAPGMVRTRVHDTGRGIAPEHIARLFFPFDRLGAETTGTPGAGLGLALTKGLVESMGGAMGVDTVVDAGSTFWFDLPSVAIGQAPEPVADEKPAANAAHGNATVLVVDDNEANLDLLRRVLALRPGTRAVFGRDGAEALALVAAEMPDLVLLDMHLPLIEGDEVLRRIKADPTTAHISIVVLSGVAEAQTIRRSRDDGADGYLTKPFDVRELLDLIDRLLSGHVQVPGGSADADSDEVLS